MPDGATYIYVDIVQTLVDIAIDNGNLLEFCVDHIQPPEERRRAEYGIEQAIEQYEGDVSFTDRERAIAALWARGIEAQEVWVQERCAADEEIWRGAAAHEARRDLG